MGVLAGPSWVREAPHWQELGELQLSGAATSRLKGCSTAMSTLASRIGFKRKLLRGAVTENLEAINKEPRGSRRRRQLQRVATVKRVAVLSSVSALVAVSVVAWIGSFSNHPDDPSPATVYLPGKPAKVIENDGVLPDAARNLAERLAIFPPDSLVPEVIPLSVSRIVVDPGHGGGDGGTSLRYGLLEKDLTLDISLRLAELLRNASLDVILTRDSDVAVSLKERVAIANQARADLFFSIHVNWLPDRTARGIETYYLGPTDDPFLSRLAAAENRSSGYSVADYRRLLEGIYADIRQSESRRLAQAVQVALHRSLLEENPEIVSRGVMMAPFVVLVATEMPAILVEVACLSNDREARLLAIPRYRERIADALFEGLTTYASAAKQETMQTAKRSGS
jgi:N-acetylmuramoyl-L-alanine amidase